MGYMDKFTDYITIKKGLERSCRLIEANQEKLNNLNYFPVADKDTGTNMAISTRRALEYMENHLSGNTPKAVLGCYCDGLLEYGRGNSGTILTMFCDGFNAGIPDTDVITGGDLARALHHAAENACLAVDVVKEGTMLTVARDAAKAGLSVAEMTDDPIVVWSRICEEARAALEATKVRNPNLRDIGVVDSGAYGLCLVLDGLFSILNPDAEPPCYDFVDTCPIVKEGDTCLHYTYCTEYLVAKKDGASAAALADLCRPLGDCLLCVENAGRIKLHIHTNSPAKIAELASGFGTIISEKMDDMSNGRVLE